ncbi:methyl-accepting chemotaxis protein [Merismopedia glauca]|uniref:Methyl-accepting chemotaxis protein n=1 Tax=Merismopedia glauca CCAP 1448/3 TaxID=1296344 RepID=A0A2T1CAH2_9CYAN|nr:methyl-accepting chemotaxis protein [Merismopedia glauca]PSB05147.1 methyl-accepting chemotaxis protein [Merismopedia glauca CCAP 1448/3]
MVFSSGSPKTNGQSTSVSADLLNPSGLRQKRQAQIDMVLPERQKPKSQGWSGLSLRTKATAIAIALGVLPIMSVGAVTYQIASQQLEAQTEASQEASALLVAQKVNNFMYERYGDLQVLSNLTFLTDSQQRSQIPLAQKQKNLDEYIASYGYYDSIAVADLNGKTILQSSGEPVTGLGERDYFKAVKETRKPVITPPRPSALTKKWSVFMAAPVFDTNTGEMIAIVRTRIPVKNIEQLLVGENISNLPQVENTSKLLDLIGSNNQIFASSNPKQLGKDFNQEFPEWNTWRKKAALDTQVLKKQKESTVYLASYVPVEGRGGMPRLGWSLVVLENETTAFIGQRRLMFTLLFGLGIAAIVVGAIAAFLANRVTRPILETTLAVEKLGQGELDTRVEVTGQDELSTLGANINHMAEQLQALLTEQGQIAYQQIALQETVARQQADNAEQQKQAKENLQQRALQLLTQVEPIAQGDLSVRATVTEDEIGTIADAYNATVNSLRKIVTQVQSAAEKMVATTSENEGSVQGLSVEALRQSQEIREALTQLQAMSSSITTISLMAKQAELAVTKANQTVANGDLAMNRTVVGILNIKETVTETTKKVQQLGEASQSISKVVKLIANFAAQTNLLALKASIEAARAGEEGRGFAVLAEEVRQLAQQSGQATSEIENIVNSIQKETQEVLTAMKTGTEQVLIGTQLVEETRQSLNQISDVSGQIDQFVSQIVNAAAEQSQASVSVTQTMDDVAEIANQTSQEAARVSAAFSQLLAVANSLQNSASQFKVS